MADTLNRMLVRIQTTPPAHLITSNHFSTLL